jgi:amino acid transporter
LRLHVDYSDIPGEADFDVLVPFLLGKPLANTEERAEHVGPIAGIPIFGLDALSSAAYGPEAALTLLIPLGMAGIAHIVDISVAIIILLAIVFFSYLQTIDAYPNGGGSYTVATENLGDRAGLLAAAALVLDYILNAAVGISAGVGALISAVPSLQPHTLLLCLAILLVLTLVNLRGVKDTGAVFLAPTYVFLGTLLLVLIIGAIRVVAANGHPVALVSPPRLRPGTSLLPIWLLLKVFASGCTAMTGVKAVSNGVMAFREPTQKNAKRTLTSIILLLMTLLAGIALLCRAYSIGATDPTGPGYQSVLSQLISAVMGRGSTTSPSLPSSQFSPFPPIRLTPISPVSRARSPIAVTSRTCSKSAAAGSSIRMESMRSLVLPLFCLSFSAS